jgi:hypothetical protein
MAVAAGQAATVDELWFQLGVSADFGGVSNDFGADSRFPDVATDSARNAFIAWQDTRAGNVEIYARRWNGTIWEEVGGSATGGGISNSPGASERPSVAIDNADNIYVAYEDVGPRGSEIIVRRWNGSVWEDFGDQPGGSISSDTGSPGGAARLPDLALDPSGNPGVAWMDNRSGEFQIMFRRFNGAAWEQLGGSFPTGGIPVSGLSLTHDGAVRPSLAIDSAGNPAVAWINRPVNSNSFSQASFADIDSSGVYVKRWNGSDWEGFGHSSVSGGGIFRDQHFRPDAVSLGLDLSASPVVAASGSSVGTVRWTGTRWERDGVVSPGPEPSLTVGPDGNHVATFQTGGNGIGVLRFDGTAWREVGDGSASGAISDVPAVEINVNPSIAVDADGNPHVAWQVQFRDFTLPAPSTWNIYYKRVIPPLAAGDANADASVDSADVVTVVNHVDGSPITNPQALRAADLDDSGTVDQADVSLLVDDLLDN